MGTDGSATGTKATRSKQEPATPADIRAPWPPPHTPLPPLTASLPLVAEDGASPAPGLMFGPASLIADAGEGGPPPEETASGAAAETARLVAPERHSATDAAFEATLAELLGADTMGAAALAGIDAAADASYDFDEYVMLRNADDPYVDPRAPGETTALPADPRMHAFATAVQGWIDQFVDQAESLARARGAYVEYAYTVSLKMELGSWWRAVCATRDFNELSMYAPTGIAERKFNEFQGLSPNEYYAYAVYVSLFPDRGKAAQYLTTRESSHVAPMLRAAYWEQLRTSLFEHHFTGLLLGGEHVEYDFDPYPTGEVLVGIQLIHRQSWRLLNYGRGELVKTIPLGPRESQKVSVNVTSRTKSARVSEDASSYETTTESSRNTKDTSDVVAEASKSVNKHAEAEVSGGYGPFIQAKVSGGIAEDVASSSRSTKTRLNEVMSKTAGRMKKDTKVTVSTEYESTFAVSRSSELTNPNDELAVTYLYHRLQQRYWVSTRIAEMHSVVFVPERLPEPTEIDDAWVARHGDVIEDALLDQGFAGVLSAIRKEPGSMPVATDARFTRSAESAIAATDNYRSYGGQGTVPNFLAAGQQFLERDVERRTAAQADTFRRRHQSDALIEHIRRNILHYMRAIWRAEDFDQRMQRYGRRRVPTKWTFVPRAPKGPGAAPTPLEVDGVFVPVTGSERPLNQVIDPIGPIGYVFNCAIYRMRDDLRLVNSHQALAWLRAAYTRFAVTHQVSKKAGVTVRYAVAVSPRSHRYEVRIVYSAARGQWLVPRPPLDEMDWQVVPTGVDGWLEVMGVRFWLDGTPEDRAELTLTVTGTGELEDPHVRMVRAQHPLPPADSAAATFTPATLRSMAAVVPAVAVVLDGAVTWGDLDAIQQQTVKDHYHEWIVLKGSGRLVALETGNVVLDLATSTTPLLEPFKRLHRYIDVVRERENTRRLELDNARRQALLDAGRLGDPDIERVSLVSAPPGFAGLVETGEPDAPEVTPS